MLLAGLSELLSTVVECSAGLPSHDLKSLDDVQMDHVDNPK